VAVALDTAAGHFGSAVQTGTVTSIATGTFTPPAGSRLWAMACFDASVGSAISWASSPVLTWNKLTAADNAGGKASMAWADVSGGGWTGTVTASCPGATFPGASIYVVPATGGETTPGGNVKTASPGSWPRDTQNSAWSGINGADFTTTQAGSIILAVTCGWSGTAGNDWTPSTNQTELFSDFNSGNYQAEFWRYNGNPAVGTYRLFMTQVNNESGDMIVAELRAGAAGPASHPNWGRVTI
jgi:hypothetical protein